MPETQIKLEILSYKELFPFYLKFLSKKLKINNSRIKIYKNYLIFSLIAEKNEIPNFIENLYNYGDLFKIQKIVYDYK